MLFCGRTRILLLLISDHVANRNGLVLLTLKIVADERLAPRVLCSFNACNILFNCPKPRAKAVRSRRLFFLSPTHPPTTVLLRSKHLLQSNQLSVRFTPMHTLLRQTFLQLKLHRSYSSASKNAFNKETLSPLGKHLRDSIKVHPVN